MSALPLTPEPTTFLRLVTDESVEPTREELNRLLSYYYDPEVSFPDIAEYFGVTVRNLLDVLDRPDIIDIIERLRIHSDRRAAAITANANVNAAGALSAIASANMLTGADPPRPESIRKAASHIARMNSAFLSPSPGPAGGDGGGGSPKPRRRGPSVNSAERAPASPSGRLQGEGSSAGGFTPPALYPLLPSQRSCESPPPAPHEE